MTPLDEPAWAKRGGPVTRAARHLPEGSLPSWAWIRPQALVAVRSGSRVLVQDYAATGGASAYRPLGGAIDHGELAEVAAKREIQEELGAEITDVRLLGVLENIYSKDDKDWHEIVFMFEARFVDRSLEEAERLVGMEGDGDRIEAVWLDVSEPVDAPLYPPGLIELLRARLAAVAADD
ncbi:MAG: NUDIX domain-containing protein [Chloroflexota bacterium]|nr:NUDIX domain-containing protein [Chloroflexota bacterium]